MPRGGRRNGSGRPKGAVSEENRLRQEIRRRMVELAHDRADELFDALMDLAIGDFEISDDVRTQKKIYQRKPDPRSIQWLLEQTVGKAAQTKNALPDQEVEPMNINVVFYDPKKNTTKS